MAKKKAAKKVTKKKVAKKAFKKTATKKAAKKVVKKTPAAKTKSLQIGDKAPIFTLKDQNGKDVSLSDFKGMNVVVYFYPRALTPGCTVQACGLRDVKKELNDLNVIVLGISGDSSKKLKTFEDKKELNFSLLADEDNKVAKSYHSYGPKKFMGREFDGILRQSFFIDGDGKIIGILHKVDTASHHDTVVKFFKDRK